MQGHKPGRKTRNNGGFTLLELTITLAVIVVISGGVFLAIRQPNRRALDNAALQLQADIRYAQRRALIGGQMYWVEFNRFDNMYRVMTMPNEEIRRVYFQDGVRMVYVSVENFSQLRFHPRGTATGGFRVRLEHGRYSRDLTATVSGGRVRIQETRYVE